VPRLVSSAHDCGEVVALSHCVSELCSCVCGVALHARGSLVGSASPVELVTP
jgi:hypothetical protein